MNEWPTNFSAAAITFDTLSRAPKLESLHSPTDRPTESPNEWRHGGALCPVVYIVVKVSAFWHSPRLVNKPTRTAPWCPYPLQTKYVPPNVCLSPFLGAESPLNDFSLGAVYGTVLK